MAESSTNIPDAPAGNAGCHGRGVCGRADVSDALGGDPNLPKAAVGGWFVFYALFLLACLALARTLLSQQPAEFHQALDGFGRLAHTVKPWTSLLKAWGGQLVELVALATPQLKLVLLVLYLSMATTFFPMPTAPVVAAIVTHKMALSGNPWLLTVEVATLGAMASTIANMTDYHLFLLLLRSNRIARIRGSRIYKVAARWFAKGPFLILVVFNILPIPVDVARMLAAIYGYPKLLFAAANFAGRFTRWVMVILLTMLLPAEKQWISPAAFLALAVLIALGKIVPALWKKPKEQQE